VDAFMCYKQKCKVVSLNLANPVDLHWQTANLCHALLWHKYIQLSTTTTDWNV